MEWFGGSELEAFDTDCGKIGVLISTMWSFRSYPGSCANRHADSSLFPFMTDLQTGYHRGALLCTRPRH